ncbi:hypothetical protein [Ornithinimicrobium kibberense]|uniref:hypothetical protein n=1 Tax=Ornithinimicrobium kibberense TaxID=282060 RepID=UPI00361D8D5F
MQHGRGGLEHEAVVGRPGGAVHDEGVAPGLRRREEQGRRRVVGQVAGTSVAAHGDPDPSLDDLSRHGDRLDRPAGGGQQVAVRILTQGRGQLVEVDDDAHGPTVPVRSSPQQGSVRPFCLARSSGVSDGEGTVPFGPSAR